MADIRSHSDLNLYCFIRPICPTILCKCFIYIYFRLEDGIQSLEKEANIDFCRSMNRIIFDQIIEQDPSTFAFVSVPEDNLKPVPTKGRPNDSFE